MSPTRVRSLLVLVVVLGGLVLAAPVSAGASRQINLREDHLVFDAFQCRAEPADHCVADVRSHGDASSNLTRRGIVSYVLVVDFFNGFEDPCNLVDEAATWTFPEGTITTESHHQDCAVHGLRIDTPFIITGGTGAFAGARGGGREFGSAGNRISVIPYIGVVYS